MLGMQTPSLKESSLIMRTKKVQGEIKNYKKWCDHCKKPYHTKDTCQKLHGKPVNWTPNCAHVEGQIEKRLQAGLPEAETRSSTFTKEQIELLKHSINQSNSTSLVAAKGTDLAIFSSITK